MNNLLAFVFSNRTKKNNLLTPPPKKALNILNQDKNKPNRCYILTLYILTHPHIPHTHCAVWPHVLTQLRLSGQQNERVRDLTRFSGGNLDKI